jgi:hypothetical protein
VKRLALALFVFALAVPAQGAAARYAVGLKTGASSRDVAKRIEARTGRAPAVLTPFALEVTAARRSDLMKVRGVAFVERMRASRRPSFAPNDPLIARQWYLGRVRAFEAWPKLPLLETVRVAIIDSGIDATHPEFANQIAAGKAFVASSWQNDTNGHGTFVAGEIAASVNNAQGIAGLAFTADLMIAKVVRSDGTISPDAEARAITWAVDNGAQVINMSFGGVRDPYDKSLDTYSPLEAAAVRYAVSKGVLVVAAVGNGDGAPQEPWGFAGYPAALPHVIGVSAVARDGTVPNFSNRDLVYNDIAAPGEAIFSTLPRALTAITRPTCAPQGYSDCGPTEFRRGEGTSFAAPQVTAAAALLLGSDVDLKADQAAQILTRSADDANPGTGCVRCAPGRDPYSGWGQLDVAEAIRSLSEPLPDTDSYEPNDDAAIATRIWGRKGQRLQATLDYWDDHVDVYGVKLRRGQRLVAKLFGPSDTDASLSLWKPGTRRVIGKSADLRYLAARSATPGPVERVRLRARKRGWYYIAVKVRSEDAGAYSLVFKKRGPRRAARAVRPR